MIRRLNRKGMLAVVMVFVITLALVVASLIYMFLARATYRTSVMKRMRGIAYAEVALYEALNRFRTNYLIPGDTNPWDAEAWAEFNTTGVAGPDSFRPQTRTVTITDADQTMAGGRITVTIDVRNTGGLQNRQRVTATIDLDTIRI